MTLRPVRFAPVSEHPASPVDAMYLAERYDVTEPQAEVPVPDVEEEKAHLIRHHSAEKPMRSLAKATSWRIWASIDTFAVTWFMAVLLPLIFGETARMTTWQIFVTATGVSIGEIVTKTGHYWIHERIWGSINWGLNPRHETKE